MVGRSRAAQQELGATPNPLDKIVGERLRRRRLLRRLSQQALGEIVGISFQQLQKYEKGINRISASRLLEFSTALQTPVMWFLDGLGYVGEFDHHDDLVVPDRDAGDELVSRSTLELLRAIFAISDPQVRSRVMSLVRAIASSETGTGEDETRAAD